MPMQLSFDDNAHIVPLDNCVVALTQLRQLLTLGMSMHCNNREICPVVNSMEFTVE